MAGVRRPIKAAADLLGHSSTASRVICTAIPPTTPRGRRLTGSGRRSGCEAREPTVLAPNSDSVLVDNRDECFHSVERKQRRIDNHFARIRLKTRAHHLELGPVHMPPVFRAGKEM